MTAYYWLLSSVFIESSVVSIFLLFKLYSRFCPSLIFSFGCSCFHFLFLNLLRAENQYEECKVVPVLLDVIFFCVHIK